MCQVEGGKHDARRGGLKGAGAEEIDLRRASRVGSKTARSRGEEHGIAGDF